MRDFGIIVVGATGLTGKLVVAQVAKHANLLDKEGASDRWAVSGRDVERTRAAVAKITDKASPIVEADLHDARALAALARRTDVVLNLAGPFTPTAGGLIAACVEAGTDYVDLSGEIPLLEEVITRFHGPATEARVRIIQMAGWEALPADLTTLVASRRAMDDGQEGQGAGSPITEVLVSAHLSRIPNGGVPMSQAVSAGTLSSIVQMLEDPRSTLVGRTDVLLPGERQGAARPGGLHLRPFRHEGRMMASFAPVAFLNPPIVHRTAVLRAAEQGVPYHSARYREGEDIGAASGLAAATSLAQGLARAGLQRTILGVAHAPAPVRKTIAAGLRRLVPKPGSGPSGRYQTDWRWAVRSQVRTIDGRSADATLHGDGHPGYAATAAMIAEVGLRLASGRAPDRFGCLTPALALGSLDTDPWFVDGLRLR